MASLTNPKGIHICATRSRVLWLVLFFCLAAAVPGAAEGLQPMEIRLAAPGDKEWRPLVFRSIDQTTVYTVQADPMGRPAYRAESHCGASAMLLELPTDFDLARTPRLTWRWRIERGIKVDGDDAIEQTKVGDDFAARVYVLFRFDSDRANRWQRLQHRIGRRLFGVETPGETLNYVWSSKVETGRSWVSPVHADARLIALDSDSSSIKSQAWREVVVDLVKDAARVYEAPPRLQPYALGLMTDADNTCQKAIAWFSDFRLLGPVTDSAPNA